MFRLFLISLAAVSLAQPVRVAAADHTDTATTVQTDPPVRALEIEQRMVDAMGGRAAWESARFFDFVWAVKRRDGGTFERHHVWDRWTGRYKLEMPLEDQRMVALFNTNTQEGTVWLDGRQVTDAGTAAKLLDRAHGAFINDTYWLIMPFKWRDPGVNLAYKGRITDAKGKTWEAVELTFDGVGRTPNNRYMAYVDPDTGLMGWWEHFRTREQTETDTRTLWTDWEQRGPIKVALSKLALDGTPRLYFPSVIISTDLNEAAFAPPAP